MNYPTTIDEAVDILQHILLDEEKKIIKNMSEDDLIELQFGLGMAIRNNFGLWAENYELIADCKTKDADVLHW